jgi:diacylglycerol kinase (ATP)
MALDLPGPTCEYKGWPKGTIPPGAEPTEVKLAMRRVALIYNPASGQYSARRRAAVQQVLDVLRQAGVAADAFVTDTPGSATIHAQQAVGEGYDAILACGGDGTVHEVLQSLVGTDVALGVIPLGTANALAANLDLIASPAKAARILLGAARVRVPVGRIHFQNGGGAPESRYFLVAAGVGADALLMSRLDPRLKRRLGYVLYLIEAFRIWATDPLPLFEVAFTSNGSGAERVAEVSQLLAVRVRSFGGALRKLAPGATLQSRTLRLLAFGTRSRYLYLRFLLAVLAGRHTFASKIELVETATVDCRARNGSSDVLYVEADGEVLGHLPAKMETVPDALTLLVPEGAEP